jgi:rubrerythrin
MTEVLKVGEMVQMGVEDERTGLAFYRELAKTARSEVVRKAATRFGDMEEVHLKAYTVMLKDVEGYEPRESYTGEYLAYLQALLRGKLFPPEEEAIRMVRDAKSDRAAVEMAIQFERNTLLLFNEIVKFLPPKDQSIVAKLIAEEQLHVTQLTGLLRDL